MRAILILPIVFITLALSGCISGTNSNLATYKNQTYGITLNYPSDWSLDYGMYNTTVFYPPKNQTTGDYDFTVTLRYHSTDNDSIHGMMHLYFDDFTHLVYPPVYHDSQVKVLTGQNITISGLPAVEVIYTDNQNMVPKKVLKLGVYLGDRQFYYAPANNWAYAAVGYTLEYNAKEDLYDGHLDEVQRLIDSIKIPK